MLEQSLSGAAASRGRVAHPLLAAEPGVLLPPQLRRASEASGDELRARGERQRQLLVELSRLCELQPLAVPGGIGLEPVSLGWLRSAGRRAPAGLPTERRVQYEATRRDAVEALRTELRGPRAMELRGALVGVLQHRLPVEESLWIEFAGAAGSVADLVPGAGAALVAELEGGVHTRRSAAARRALHNALGLWFKDGTAVREYLGDVPQWPGPGARERLRVEEGRRLALLDELWKLEPARTLTSLDAVSPEERGRAALALAEGARGGGVELEAALAGLVVGDGGLQDGGLQEGGSREGAPQDGAAQDGAAQQGGGAGARAVARILLDCIAFETDPAALCLQLEAFVATQGVAGADSDALIKSARELLSAGVEHAPLELAVCLGRAVAVLPARLAAESSAPWGATGESEAPTWGLEQLGRWMVRVRSAERIDEDLVVGLLDAVRGHVRAAGIRGGSGKLAGPVLELARETTATAGTRLAAVAAMRDLGRAEDLKPLAVLLSRPGLDPDFGYALLGVVGHLTATREMNSDRRAQVLEAGLAVLRSEQVDLRRGALELLGSEPLTERLTDPAVLEALTTAAIEEREPELVDANLRLLARGDARGALSRLLQGDLVEHRLGLGQDAAPALLGQLHRLAGEDRSLGLRASSEVLARVDGPARVLLLEMALGFSLDGALPGELAELDSASAGELVRWAADLEQFEARWRPFSPERRALFERLLDEVLVRVPEADRPGPLARARLLAAAGRGFEEIEFELGRAAMNEGGAPPELERARLALRTDAPEIALASYRRHVEAAAIERVGPGTDELVIVRFAWLKAPVGLVDLVPGDLRRLLELSVPGEHPAADAAWKRDVAAGAALALLNHPKWRETDVDAALIDVDRMTQAVMRSDWALAAEQLAARFEAALDDGGAMEPEGAASSTEFWRELVSAGSSQIEQALSELPSRTREPLGSEPDPGAATDGDRGIPPQDLESEREESSTTSNPGPLGG